MLSFSVLFKSWVIENFRIAKPISIQFFIYQSKKECKGLNKKMELNKPLQHFLSVWLHWAESRSLEANPEEVMEYMIWKKLQLRLSCHHFWMEIGRLIANSEHKPSYCSNKQTMNYFKGGNYKVCLGR